MGNYDYVIRACMILCEHLNVEAKIPDKDTIGNPENLTEEILHFSGLRFKDVDLEQDWWKSNNGFMLGTLQNGIPVALIPGKISGYCLYDPRLDRPTKIDADAAVTIKPEATAIFRTFPDGKIKPKTIWEFILRENLYKEISLILLSGLIAAGIRMIPPFVSLRIFDVIIPENLRTAMVEVTLMLLVFAAANVGFSVFINLCVARINTKGSLAVQAALWDRIISLPVPFFGKYTTGELLQKTKSIEQVKNLVSMEALQSVSANIFAFIYVIVLFSFNVLITFYVLGLFLVLFIVYAIAGKLKLKLYKRHTDLENYLAGFTHQIVGGMYRIKVSGAKERICEQWEAYEAEKRSVRGKIDKINRQLIAFHFFFDFASVAAVYLMTSLVGSIAVGVFVAYFSAFLILQGSVKSLLNALNALPELIALCGNIGPILEEKPEHGTRKLIPKDMSGTIEANHASFKFTRYGREALSDISFRVEEGESIGIVGLSGGGKTTLLKLLMGFYELSAGKIYYGGYDLETIDMRWLRKQMGVALQNGNLSGGDIYSNVTDNDNSVPLDAVVEALQISGLRDKIKDLPHGFNTSIEDYPFSEGEKQKLLIARAVAKKSKFLFLDEATSSLDSISQGEILENLKNIPATKIIIAQRLATVKHCNKVIVIEKGRLVDAFQM